MLVFALFARCVAAEENAPAPVADAVELLFEEHFDDPQFAARDWYDGRGATLSSTIHAPNSSSSFECVYAQGATSCAGGTPARRQFKPTDTLYVEYWVKYSDNWIGSGLPYHPHEFHITTTEDGKWVGPSRSSLTLYIEAPLGRPLIAMQDSNNIDAGCILRDDDSFEGCNGAFDRYRFTEARSAAACNGLQGSVDGRSCYQADGQWYSSRSWQTTEAFFTGAPGPRNKSDWHKIGVYFRLNQIVGGVGIADGVLRYWFDDELVLRHDDVLFRTGAHPLMQFNQLLLLPYMGNGSPVTQTMWVDELRVATGQPTEPVYTPAQASTGIGTNAHAPITDDRSRRGRLYPD